MSSVTYPGNVADAFPPDRLLGYHSQHYLPMSATYHRETNRTVVELRRLNEAQLIEYLNSSRVETIEAAEDRLRVSGLFGGAL